MKAQTIETIVASLPNGFEDCVIHALHLEVASRSAYLDIAVITKRNWGATSDLRLGRLSATNVHVLFVEPPDALAHFLLEGRGLTASGDLELNGMNDRIEKIISRVPPGAEIVRFFLEDWNSFLYLAADSYKFSWQD